MKNQKHYQYALNHRFSNNEEVFKNNIGNGSDFLIQEGRWRFDGD